MIYTMDTMTSFFYSISRVIHMRSCMAYMEVTCGIMTGYYSLDEWHSVDGLLHDIFIPDGDRMMFESFDSMQRSLYSYTLDDYSHTCEGWPRLSIHGRWFSPLDGFLSKCFAYLGSIWHMMWYWGITQWMLPLFYQFQMDIGLHVGGFQHCSACMAPDWGSLSVPFLLAYDEVF